MNRRLSSPRFRPATAAAVVVTAAALSGCAPVIDYFGPKPDPVLVQLAAQAEADGRQEQADALYAEVARLCGVHADGTSPHSCEVDRAAARAALAATPAPDPLTADVPAESRELLVSQAIDRAAADQTAQPADAALLTTASPLDAAAQESANALLEREYEMVWSLDMARAFAAPADEERIDSLIARHEGLARDLAGALAASDATPVEPAASYTIDGERPTDAPTALGFVDALTAADAQAWAKAAASAPAGPWQNWLIATAATLRA